MQRDRTNSKLPHHFFTFCPPTVVKPAEGLLYLHLRISTDQVSLHQRHVGTQQAELYNYVSPKASEGDTLVTAATQAFYKVCKYPDDSRYVEKNGDLSHVFTEWLDLSHSQWLESESNLWVPVLMHKSSSFWIFWTRTPAASGRIRIQVVWTRTGSGLDLDFVICWWRMVCETDWVVPVIANYV